MTSSRRSTHRSKSRVDQVAAYLDQLFGSSIGVVVIAIGIGGHLTKTGSYRFRGGLKHNFFNWPDQRQGIIDLVLSASGNHDLYVIPNLRSAPNAKKGSCLGADHCWADIDQITAGTQRRLSAVLSQGSFVVHSGRGLHVYVLLDGFYPAKVIDDLNRRLASYLPADSKWAENALLRLPGTFNHKGRAMGEQSYPVTFEDGTDFCVAPWSPAVLQELLGPYQPSPSKPRRSAGRKGSQSPKRAKRRAVQILTVDPEPIHDVPEAIRKLLPFTARRGLGGDQSRSGQLHRLVGVCMAHGYSDGQTMGVAILHEPAQEKWPEEGALHHQIQRSNNRLRPEHPHVGRSCTDAGCQSNARSDVLRRVDEVRSHFQMYYTSRSPVTDSKAMDALLRLASEVGTLELSVSVRRLCLLASVSSQSTISKCLDRLEEAGYVKKRRRSNGTPITSGNAPVVTRSHCFLITVPTNQVNVRDCMKEGEGKSGASLKVNKVEALTSQGGIFGGSGGVVKEIERGLERVNDGSNGNGSNPLVILKVTLIKH